MAELPGKIEEHRVVHGPMLFILGTMTAVIILGGGGLQNGEILGHGNIFKSLFQS